MMFNLIETVLTEIVPRLARWIGLDGLFARVVYRGISTILCGHDDAKPQDVEDALKIITPEQAKALKEFECECYGKDPMK